MGLVFGGRHLARDVVGSSTNADFEIKEVERFHEPGSPRFAGAHSLGRAAAA